MVSCEMLFPQSDAQLHIYASTRQRPGRVQTRLMLDECLGDDVLADEWRVCVTQHV